MHRYALVRPNRVTPTCPITVFRATLADAVHDAADGAIRRGVTVEIFECFETEHDEGGTRHRWEKIGESSPPLAHSNQVLTF